MKSILPIYFLFFPLIIFSQAGTVEYNLISKKYEAKKSDENVKNILNDINDTDLQFELNFNATESFFFEKNELKDEELSMGQKLNRILISYRPFYYTKQLDLFYFPYEDVVVEKKKNINWVLSSESKKINNYNCYKATYVETYINRIGQNKERIITAWYCPDIPFSYGPIDYNNLPGLILELEKNDNKYVAKKITFRKSNTIIKPIGKIISEDDYLKKLKENAPF